MCTRSVVVVALIVAVAMAAGPTGCARFTSCAECVFDASEGVFSRYENCTWCPGEQTCVNGAVTACKNPQWLRGDNKCADMRCSAAHSTNNIYICRPNIMAALVFTVFLLILSLIYFFWWSTITQMPWRYANIHDATNALVAERGSVIATFASGDGPSASAKTQRSNWVPQNPENIPEEEFYWQTVARWAFFPLFLGTACGLISLVLVIFVSLKPWFADAYYGFLLAIPYVVYIGFITYVYKTRMPVPGDSKNRLSTFFRLSWLLRGRNIKTVFQVEDQSTSNPTPRATSVGGPEIVSVSDSPTTISLPPPATATPATALPSKQQLLADTARLLNFEESIEKNFRKKLRDALDADEYIDWWEKPSRYSIMVDNRWLVHFFATMMVVGLWLWSASSLKESEFMIARFFSDTGLATFGIIIFFVFFVSLCVTIHGCNRLYVMTNKRLILMADGLVGSMHMTATSIEKVSCASIIQYEDVFFGPMNTFSWEAPQKARKLPAIKTNAFACIKTIEEFLPKFKELAGPLESSVLDEQMVHLRLVWRMHIGFNLMVVTLLPILFLYTNMVPGELGVLGLIVFFSFNFCFIQRGLRVQQLTVIPLNLAKEWSKWDQNKSQANRFLRRLFESGVPNLSLGGIREDRDKSPRQSRSPRADSPRRTALPRSTTEPIIPQAREPEA